MRATSYPDAKNNISGTEPRTYDNNTKAGGMTDVVIIQVDAVAPTNTGIYVKTEISKQGGEIK